MNEASIEIPDGWYDQTIHIFSSEPPGKPGPTMVISKEKLVKGKDLASYKRMVMSKLPQELPGLKILNEEKFLINRDVEAELVEHTWNSDHGLIHHYQAMLVQKKSGLFSSEENTGYCFTMSVMEGMHKVNMEEQFKKMVSTFKFDR